MESVVQDGLIRVPAARDWMHLTVTRQICYSRAHVNVINYGKPKIGPAN